MDLELEYEVLDSEGRRLPVSAATFDGQRLTLFTGVPDLRTLLSEAKAILEIHREWMDWDGDAETEEELQLAFIEASYALAESLVAQGSVNVG